MQVATDKRTAQFLTCDIVLCVPFDIPGSGRTERKTDDAISRGVVAMGSVIL
jgi:hypothetical protein